MTPNEIFSAAAALTFQTTAQCADLAGFVPDLLGALLREALPFENALRTYEHGKKLDTPPVITADLMDADLAWHDALPRCALPCGLAAELFHADGDTASADEFRGRFCRALDESVRTRAEAAADAYGEDT